MRLIGLRPLFVLGCLLSVVYPTGAQTDFDNGNKQGVRRNPAGLKLVLRTKDGRMTFHFFETIPVELEFSSSRPSTFSIELDEIMNFSGWTRKFEVEPENAILLTFLEWQSQGVICCGYERRALSQQPTVLHRELTDYLRFEKAGTYRVFLNTRRVFREPSKDSDFGGSKILLTSNILTLTILPDDPEWDAQRFAEALRKLRDPHVKANYSALEQEIKNIDSETSRDVALENRLNQTELVQAQRALNALDTQEAIRERVRLMGLVPREESTSKREFGGRMVLYQPLLASSTRPDLIIASMEERAEDPDFGVDYDYVDWWAKYIVLRDHIELFRTFPDETEHQKRIHSFPIYEVAAKQEIALRLESLLTSKRGVAKNITTLTLKAVKDDIAEATHSDPLHPKRKGTPE
jgi:hypothetical protein